MGRIWHGRGLCSTKPAVVAQIVRRSFDRLETGAECPSKTRALHRTEPEKGVPLLQCSVARVIKIAVLELANTASLCPFTALRGTRPGAVQAAVFGSALRSTSNGLALSGEEQQVMNSM